MLNLIHELCLGLPAAAQNYYENVEVVNILKNEVEYLKHQLKIKDDQITQIISTNKLSNEQ